MAPFYRGNTLLKAYVGNTVVQKVYQGSSLLYQNRTATPTISITSVGDTSITLSLTNNDSATATIYYEHSDATPDASSTSVAAGATTSVTISGLSELSSYTVYAQAVIAGKENSYVVSDSTTTTGWTQYGSEYDKSSGSALRNTYNGSTWFRPTFNNSSISRRYWKFVCTSDSGALSNEYWSRLEVGAYNGTNYTNSSILSYSGYIVTYINSPANAFANDSNTAASISGGSHIGSTIHLDFGTNVTLNKIWIRTGYTKISGMTLYYK